MSEAAVKRRGRPATPTTIKDDRTPWSEAEKKELRELRESGATFVQCAKELRRSRAACIGAWDRISGRCAEREKVTMAERERAERGVRISLGGPAWSRPERYQS